MDYKSCVQIVVVAGLCVLHLATAQNRNVANQMRNVCDRHWELIYSHDENGNVILGDKRLLRELAMTGSLVKVQMYMPDHILQLSAVNMNKRGDELCFQSLRALSHNGSHIDDVDPWLYFMVCTTGDVTERGVNHTSHFRVEMNWRVKEIACDSKPIYSSYIDGSPKDANAVASLQEAAKHMALTCAMRDKPYLFPLDNVILDQETGEVTGQNVNHIGQTYRENYVTFHNTPYRWLSMVSSFGRRDNARWAIQGHNKYNHNNDTAALDWYADVCWRLVYTIDEDGFDEFGTVDDLIDYINKGHRVRVRYDDMTVEVSNMRVKDKIVAAQVLHEVSRVGGWEKDRYHIETDTRAKFSIVHTTGKINTHEYLIGSNIRKVIPAQKKKIEWMVDTRPWRAVLQTRDPPGEVVKGKALDLDDAIAAGASIRINVVLDQLAGSFFTNADNLRVDLMTNTIFAQSMDHLSDKKSSQPGEYEFQRHLFRWYLLISSEGPVRMSAWMYGTDEHKYDEGSPEADVTWFANM